MQIYFMKSQVCLEGDWWDQYKFMYEFIEHLIGPLIDENYEWVQEICDLDLIEKMKYKFKRKEKDFL